VFNATFNNISEHNINALLLQVQRGVVVVVINN